MLSAELPLLTPINVETKMSHASKTAVCFVNAPLSYEVCILPKFAFASSYKRPDGR